jgi:CIC family chloride channel protein
MAAAVGATFHAPLGGGIFAVEIIQRANMRYRDLFPSIIAASIAVLVMDAAGWQPLIDLSGGGAGGGMASGTLSVAAQSLRLGNGVWILLFALAIGALSGLFVRGYSAAARIFRRGHGAVWLKVAIGMGSGAAIMALISPSFAGAAGAATNALARGVVPALSFDAALPLWVAALILLVARSMAVFLTVGSGMNAGLTGPAVQAGMLAAIGAAAVVAEFSDALLLPTFLVVGFSGMLAGAMNVPIAAALLGIEVFGREFGVAAAIASVIAFQLNRGTMIYDVALADDADEAPSGPGASDDREAPDEREAPDDREAPDTPGTANATRAPGASNAPKEPPPREPPN